MSEHVVARIDVVPEQRERFLRWLRDEHLPSAGDVPGLDPAPVVYRAQLVETAIRTYRPEPEITIVYPLAAGATVHELAASPTFLDWWAGAVTARFTWVASHDWVACRRVHGPAEPIGGDRVLLTQVHVAPGHESGWARWYRERHVPDAEAVSGFFAGPMWQLEAFDVNADGWHVAPRPRFTHVLPLSDGADWLTGTATREFRALAADTQTTWAGAVEHVASNLCERIA
ncbi:MAG TPA: hypothetical protein VFV85_02535 [Conexibacter sp.]|nr:hypothetical protein [Conexibacter sp.]